MIGTSMSTSSPELALALSSFWESLFSLAPHLQISGTYSFY